MLTKLRVLPSPCRRFLELKNFRSGLRSECHSTFFQLCSVFTPLQNLLPVSFKFHFATLDYIADKGKKEGEKVKVAE